MSKPPVTAVPSNGSFAMRAQDYPDPLPPFMSIKRTCQFTGYSRSKVYEKIGRGCYDARKDGAKTIISTASVIADQQSLPAATIRPTARDRRKQASQAGA
jgi:hypothetical protein